ncbi:peptide deformylase [Bifidobacterium dolichotidis]|uniref:Peptide deformylase n=1 Tax=Bifidobacterium dolichotidis TaxID=2306976 RepID=A0A430FPX1_9BIFI|nr:peptide deformylase [Bifidobacterium dolichotidis]RSX54880.1 peptide deformylase [Bifidobacterium dolichotidis]
MQRPIETNVSILSKVARDADPSNPEDLSIAQDLKDTLEAHRDGCVGMAANMIGEPVRIIAFVDEMLGGRITVLFNPRITASAGLYETSEGCLSLDGMTNVRRAERIEVDYMNRKGKNRHAIFDGFTAQIIQHEVDHCDGILV